MEANGDTQKKHKRRVEGEDVCECVYREFTVKTVSRGNEFLRSDHTNLGYILQGRAATATVGLFFKTTRGNTGFKTYNRYLNGTRRRYHDT